MARGIKLAELPTEARQEVNSKNGIVPEKVVILGKVLQLFQGMDRREVFWILKRARNQFV